MGFEREQRQDGLRTQADPFANTPTPGKPAPKTAGATRVAMIAAQIVERRAAGQASDAKGVELLLSLLQRPSDVFVVELFLADGVIRRDAKVVADALPRLEALSPDARRAYDLAIQKLGGAGLDAVVQNARRGATSPSTSTDADDADADADADADGDGDADGDAEVETDAQTEVTTPTVVAPTPTDTSTTTPTGTSTTTPTAIVEPQLAETTDISADTSDATVADVDVDVDATRTTSDADTRSTDADADTERDAIELPVIDLPSSTDVASKRAATEQSKRAIEAALAPLRERLRKAKTRPERQKLAWQLFVAMNPSLSALPADELAKVKARFDAEFDAGEQRRAQRKTLVANVNRANSLGNDKAGQTRKRQARRDAQWALFLFDNPGFATLDAAQQEKATQGFDDAFGKFEARRARMETLRVAVEAATRQKSYRDRLGFTYRATPPPTAALEANYRELFALGLGTDRYAKAVSAKWSDFQSRLLAQIGRENAAIEKARKAARDGNYRSQAVTIFKTTYGSNPEAARAVCAWAYGETVWQDTKIAGLAGHRVIDLLYNQSGARLVGETRVEYILRAIAWKHLENDQTRARAAGGSPLYLDLQKWGRGVTDELVAAYTDKSITSETRKVMAGRIELEEAIADAELRRKLGRGGAVPTTKAEQDAFTAKVVGKTPSLVDGTPFKLGDFENQMYAVATYQKGIYEKLEADLPPEIEKLEAEAATLQEELEKVKATETTLGRATGQRWAYDAPQQLKIIGEKRTKLEADYKAKADELDRKRADYQYVKTVRPQLLQYLDWVKNGKPTTDGALKAAFPRLYELKILQPRSMSNILFPGQPTPDRVPVTASELSLENLERVEATLRQRLAQREQQTADGVGKAATAAGLGGMPGADLVTLYRLIQTYDAGREIDTATMDRKDLEKALELVGKARVDVQNGAPFVPGMIPTDNVGQRMTQYRTSWQRYSSALVAGAEDAGAFALRVVGGALNYSLPGLAEWGADALARQLVGEPQMQFGLMWMADRLRDGAAWLEKDAEANFRETGGGFDVELLRFGANAVLTALPTFGFGTVGAAVGAALKAGRWGKLLMTSASMASLGVLATADQDLSVKLRTIIPMAALPIGGGALAKSGVTARLVGSFLSNALSDVLVSADYAAAWPELKKGNISGAVAAAGATVNPARAIINGLTGVAFEGVQMKGERTRAAEVDKMPVIVSETVDAKGAKVVEGARLVAEAGETRVERITDPKLLAKLRAERGAVNVRPDELAVIVDPKTPPADVGAILSRAELTNAARAETESNIKQLEATLPMATGAKQAEVKGQLEQLGSVRDALDGKPLSDAEVGVIGVPPGYYKPAGGTEWVFDPKVEAFQLELAQKEAALVAGPEQSYWASREALTKNVIELERLRESPAKHAARIKELEAKNGELMKQVVTDEIALRQVRDEQVPALRAALIANIERVVGGTVRAPEPVAVAPVGVAPIAIPDGVVPQGGGQGQVYRVDVNGQPMAIKVVPEGGNLDIALAGAQLPAKYGGLGGGEIVPVVVGGKETQGVKMPWVEGETLANATRATPKQVAELDWFTKAALADGVVIADLNPSNIILRERGVAIVDAPLVTRETFAAAARTIDSTITDAAIAKDWAIAQDTFKRNVETRMREIRMKTPWWEYQDGSTQLDPLNFREGQAPQYLASGSMSDVWTHKQNWVVKTLPSTEMYGGLSPEVGARLMAAIVKLSARANAILGSDTVPRMHALTAIKDANGDIMPRPVLVQKRVVDGQRIDLLPEPRRKQYMDQAAAMVQELASTMNLPITEHHWKAGNMTTVDTWTIDGNPANFLLTPDGKLYWIDPFFPPAPEMIQKRPELLDVP